MGSKYARDNIPKSLCSKLPSFEQMYLLLAKIHFQKQFLKGSDLIPIDIRDIDSYSDS